MKTFNMKKIVKRIAAMGAAVMMMSSMAIGASAYSGSINLHYTSGAPSSDNTTKNSWTVYTSTPTQTMKITSFTRGNGSAYVNLFNPMGINSNVSSVTTKTKALAVQCALPLWALSTRLVCSLLKKVQ